MEPKNGFGARHRECREDLGLSLMAVASQLGRNVGTVCEWETRDRVPGVHDLAKLARLFGVRFEWLALGTGKKNLPKKKPKRRSKPPPAG